MPPTTQKPKIDTAKLSPEEKALLLAELQAESTAEATAAADLRSAAIKSLMADRDHLRDCPTGRTEMYGATRPADPRKGIGPKDVTVIRCQECGGSTVLDESYDATVALVDSMISETEEVD